MKHPDNPLHKLSELLKNNGKICLLPQNLPDEILESMEKEAIALEEERDDLTLSLLLVAILELKSEGLVSLSGKLEISQKELMDNFYVYSSSVRLELLRRSGKLAIAEESLPTLENILDGNRVLNVTSHSC